MGRWRVPFVITLIQRAFFSPLLDAQSVMVICIIAMTDGMRVGKLSGNLQCHYSSLLLGILPFFVYNSDMTTERAGNWPEALNCNAQKSPLKTHEMIVSFIIMKKVSFFQDRFASELETGHRVTITSKDSVGREMWSYDLLILMEYCCPIHLKIFKKAN